METELEREEHAYVLCFCTSIPLAYDLWNCGYFALSFTVQPIQGSATQHSHQLSVFPFLLPILVNVLHSFIFYWGKAQLWTFLEMINLINYSTKI
jgi:hypothetical protein